jgi:SAM-dependent methyltransferase
MMFQSKKNKDAEKSYRAELFDLRFGKGGNLKCKTADKNSYFDIWVRPQLAEIDSALKDVPLNNAVVLELGSESGHVAGYIKTKYTPRLSIASDIAESIIKAMPKVCDELHFKYPDVIVLDNNELPFKEKSIDVIVIYAVLHHFPDPAHIMRQIRRVLKPGGSVVILGEPFLPRYLLIFQIFHDRFDKALGICENIFSFGQWVSFMKEFDIERIWYYPPRVLKNFIPENSRVCRWGSGGGINFLLKG